MAKVLWLWWGEGCSRGKGFGLVLRSVESSGSERGSGSLMVVGTTCFNNDAMS